MAAALIEQLAAWQRTCPSSGETFHRDMAALADWHEASAALLGEMVTPAEQAALAREKWRTVVRQAHTAALRCHRAEIRELVASQSPERILTSLELSPLAP